MLDKEIQAFSLEFFGFPWFYLRKNIGERRLEERALTP
jgi:hypothetical protein